MRINNILTSCQLDLSKYIPMFCDIWTYILPSASITVLLVADEIPKYLNDYQKYIKLMPKVLDLPDEYYSSLLRVLYAGSPVFPIYETVLISDVNYLPMNNRYIMEKIENIDNMKYVHFFDNSITAGIREIVFHYDIATTRTYGEVFNPDCANIIQLMTELYNEKTDLNNFFIGSLNGWISGSRNVELVEPSPLPDVNSMIRLGNSEFDYFNNMYSSRGKTELNELFRRCMKSAMKNLNYIDYIGAVDYDKYYDYNRVIVEVIKDLYYVPQKEMGKLKIVNPNFSVYSDMIETFTISNLNN